MRACEKLRYLPSLPWPIGKVKVLHAMLSKDSRRTSRFCSSPVYPCTPGAIPRSGCVHSAPLPSETGCSTQMQQLEVRVRMRYYAIRIPNGTRCIRWSLLHEVDQYHGTSSVIAVKLSRACLTYLVPCMQALGKSGTTHIWCFRTLLGVKRND